MKTHLPSALRIGLLTLMFSFSFPALSQTDLAVWTFDILATNPAPASVAANLGPQSGTAYMYLDGTNGSSVWQNALRDAGNGIGQNDPRLPKIPGDAYRINPGGTLQANGKSIVFKVSMTGFENPVLSFAVHGTATSFSHQWAWSTDGSTFTNFGTDTQNLANNWQTRSLDMSAINQVDNASDVYLRLTVNGATSNLGRNRFDNIRVTASEQAPTFGGISQDAAACSGLPSQFSVIGLLPNSTSTISYNINAGPTATVVNIVSDGSGNGNFEIILQPINNGQVLTVTSIQRTDHPTAVVTVNANNTANLQVITSVTYFADSDGDGYGDLDSPMVSCDGLPAGHVTNSLDCDDTDEDVNPSESEVLYNGYDDNCDGMIDEGFQLTTQLKTNQCGWTIPAIYSTISAAVPHPNMTGYRFEVTNLQSMGVQTIESSTNYFQLTDLADYQFGTTYAVRVELQRNGVWLGYYGSACTITSPSLTSGPSAIVIPQCSTTLAQIFSPIFITGPNFISSYHIRVTNLTNPFHPQAVQTLTRTVPWFTLKMLTAYDYATTYSIECQVMTTGAYSAYSSACNVTTPAAPAVAPENQPIATSELRAVPYPNPFDGGFAITMNNDKIENVQIKIYDMLGNLRSVREVAPSEIASQQLGENLRSGVYNVIVTQNGVVQSLRVIKR